MSALEHEIIERFRQLDKPAQRRVLALIEQEIAAEVAQTGFDYDEWFRTVETLCQQIRTSQGT